MFELLQLVMRWLHIASVAALIGGILYWRMALTRAASAFAPETRDELGSKAAAAFRPIAFVAMACLLGSGIYNILSAPGHSVLYHALLGIKLLLVGHVFAVTILIVQPKNARRTRMLTGVMISGLTVIAISAYLHCCIF
jgi:cytochrome bd-type quinol oxidase subunit 2